MVADERRRLALTHVSGYPVAQVYAPEESQFICYEPMTAPVDALISGDGLRWVQPGEEFEAIFTISVDETVRREVTHDGDLGCDHVAPQRARVQRRADCPTMRCERILEAGWRAPSSRNWQPWDFVVVTDRAQLQELSKVWQGGGHIARAAAAVGSGDR